jgi:hypothetical protein
MVACEAVRTVGKRSSRWAVQKARPIEFHLDALMAAPTATCWVDLGVDQMVVD